LVAFLLIALSSTGAFAEAAKKAPTAKILEGKTALVTGSGRGLGRAIAQQLAAAGALVAINYSSNDEAARETLKSIEAKGGKGFLIKVHLGTRDAAQFLAKTLEFELTKRTGNSGLDILVNNIGGADYANINTTTQEVYDKTFAQNLGTTFFVTQAMIPSLRQGGRVVNISSTGAKSALQQLIVYSMAKSAVETFTRAVAKDLGPKGITVNAVAPSFIATDAAAEDLKNPDTVKYMASQTALGRGFAQPEEVASVVYTLCTPAMGWVTGQVIEASGGFRL
jgi:NAD(P)-dependent dehydrogenase (short-subunit alcohol dehydrogenase family)